MKKAIVYMCFVCLASCGQENTPAKSIVDIIEKGTDSITWRRYDHQKRIVETITSYYGAKLKTEIVYNSPSGEYPEKVQSHFIEKKYGHDFIFDAKGNIVTYSYYVGNGILASYIRSYEDPQNFREQGTILVDYIKNDQKDITLIFVDVFHDSLSAEVTSKRGLQRLHLFPSVMQPMLLETEIDVKDDSVLFVSISGKDKVSKRLNVYFDTLYIGE